MLPKELGGRCRLARPTLRSALIDPVPAGVVDPLTLKVYGTNNLRVVDASLMPMQIAAHPQRTVYAIAERVRPTCDIYRSRIESIHRGVCPGFRHHPRTNWDILTTT